MTVCSLHPGTIETELNRDYSDDPDFMKSTFAFIESFGDRILTPPEGALTTLYCCLEPSIAQHSGRYYEYVVYDGHITYDTFHSAEI